MCYRDVADLKAFPAQVVFMKSCRAKPSTVKKHSVLRTCGNFPKWGPSGG